MGKYALKSDAKRLEIEDDFILDNTVWRECKSNENLFDAVFLLEGEYPIYVSFFKAVGLKLPFDPLLMDFLRETRFHLGQLTPNIVSIVLGIVELNRRFNLTLGIEEIKYYYSFNQVDEKWNLRATPNSQSLIEGLTSSYKGMYKDIVVITSSVEPDPQNKLVPKQFGSPVGGAKEGFAKPDLDDININQLNAIINRKGLKNQILINHPRSEHILLGYPLPNKSFSSRTVLKGSLYSKGYL